MELALIMYLVGLLDSVTAVAFIAAIVLPFGLLFAYMAADLNNNTERFIALLIRQKKWFVCLLVFWGIAIIAPSEKTAHLMFAAYAGQEIAQMEETKEVGGKAYAALNKVLDDYLEPKKGE
jgi:hypothetical protein